MPFSGSGTGISNATDVFFTGLAQNNVLKYNNTTAKWNNVPVTGFAALAYNGGEETVSTVTSTASTTLNLANGNVFGVTLNVATTTFTFSGATSGKACSFSLYLTQNATGNRAVAWPGAVKWAGGTAPTISTAANAVDVLVFESLDGGTTWFGSLVGTDFS